MSKFKKLHNEPMLLKLGFLKKDVSCPTLVDKVEPFFLDMAINIGIAVLKRHGFTAPSTSGFPSMNGFDTCQMPVCLWIDGRTPPPAAVLHIYPESHGRLKKHPC